MNKTLTMIMAGGKGERLYPLTRDRAKPAVPFGGIYRIIDFTLSNCLNSNMRQIYILTQYKGHSLHRHVHSGWNIFTAAVGEFIEIIPAQQRIGDKWYQGTADSVFQNLHTVDKHLYDQVLILSGDHVYKMDYGDMIKQHKESGAELTVAVFATERKKASEFGVLEVNSDNDIIGFEEKPEDPKATPDNPDYSLISMGIYIFDTKVMIRKLVEDAKNDSSHDFGHDIIPAMINNGHKVKAYMFKDRNTHWAPYWRDIGTLDSYYESSMDLVSINPQFNLYDKNWPIHTYREEYPPCKTVFSQQYEGGRMGNALDSLVADGCIISGGRVLRSILSYNVRINSYSEVRDSVIMEDVIIGRHAKIKNAIIDKGVIVPPGMRIGYDYEEDAANFTLTDKGIVVVPKEMRL